MAGGTGYVNQGPDARFGGPLGRFLAGFQRDSAFKSSTPPRKTVTRSDDGMLTEVSYSQPGDKPFFGIAIPRGDKWDTFRIGWRWDPNWGDANLAPGSYNPQPEIIGGYFFDIILKLGQKAPHIYADET